MTIQEAKERNINWMEGLNKTRELYSRAMRYFPKSAKRLELLDRVKELQDFWNITIHEIKGSK